MWFLHVYQSTVAIPGNRVLHRNCYHFEYFIKNIFQSCSIFLLLWFLWGDLCHNTQYSLIELHGHGAKTIGVWCVCCSECYLHCLWSPYRRYRSMCGCALYKFCSWSLPPAHIVIVIVTVPWASILIGSKQARRQSTCFLRHRIEAFSGSARNLAL